MTPAERKAIKEARRLDEIAHSLKLKLDSGRVSAVAKDEVALLARLARAHVQTLTTTGE